MNIPVNTIDLITERVVPQVGKAYHMLNSGHCSPERVIAVGKLNKKLALGNFLIKFICHNKSF